ncbi:MAG: PIN domain-containing protein [Gluconacetobacter diazotrophicus]|nr:PIN domain-containing protein [Gluconacetobacter diazotrophicus]
MFDTNTVGDLVRGHEAVLRRVEALDPRACCISAITAGEIAYGLARRPDASRLHRSMEALLERLDVLPWDRAVAARYGALRADRERQGLGLGALDTMIAAHALAADLLLASADRAFGTVPGLRTVDFRVT